MLTNYPKGDIEMDRMVALDEMAADKQSHHCMCGVAIPESCDMCRDCFDILYPNAPHA